MNLTNITILICRFSPLWLLFPQATLEAVDTAEEDLVREEDLVQEVAEDLEVDSAQEAAEDSVVAPVDKFIVMCKFFAKF